MSKGNASTSVALSVSERLEKVNLYVGHAIAWLTLIMAIFTGIVVVERYWFAIGSIRMQESITFMHAAVFMLAAGYTLAAGDHVRVDIIYSNMRPRAKAFVDFVGTLLLLLPVCLFVVWSSWDYVATSWAIHETSQESGGLPYPFPSILKSLIPLTALLLILQGIVLLLTNLHTLIHPDSASHTVA